MASKIRSSQNTKWVVAFGLIALAIVLLIPVANNLWWTVAVVRLRELPLYQAVSKTAATQIKVEEYESIQCKFERALGRNCTLDQGLFEVYVLGYDYPTVMGYLNYISNNKYWFKQNETGYEKSFDTSISVEVKPDETLVVRVYDKTKGADAIDIFTALNGRQAVELMEHRRNFFERYPLVSTFVIELTKLYMESADQ